MADKTIGTPPPGHTPAVVAETKAEKPAVGKVEFSNSDLAGQLSAKEVENQRLREQIAALQKNQKAISSSTLGDEDILKAKPKDGEIAIADCRVWLDKENDVPKFGVTPAEVVLLVAQFHSMKGDIPVHSIVPHTVIRPVLGADKKIVRKDDGTADLTEADATSVPRLPHQEVGRLKGKYGKDKVEALFPGANPALPQTFREAVQMGLSVVLPGASLSKEQGGDALGAIVIKV